MLSLLQVADSPTRPAIVCPQMCAGSILGGSACEAQGIGLKRQGGQSVWSDDFPVPTAAGGRAHPVGGRLVCAQRMSKTSRREYLRQLQRALDDLQAINSRFQQRVDLVAARDNLNRWKETTRATIEGYGAFEDERTCRAHVDFDVLGLTGGYVLDGIEKYRHHLRDLVKTTSTGDLGPRVTYKYSLDATTVGNVSLSRVL